MKVEDAVIKIEELHEESLNEEMSHETAIGIAKSLGDFSGTKGVPPGATPDSKQKLKSRNTLAKEFNKLRGKLNRVPETEVASSVKELKRMARELKKLDKVSGKLATKEAGAKTKVEEKKRSVAGKAEKAKTKAEEKAMADRMVGKKAKEKVVKSVKPKEKAYSILFGKNEDTFKGRVKSYLRGS